MTNDDNDRWRLERTGEDYDDGSGGHDDNINDDNDDDSDDDDNGADSREA